MNRFSISSVVTAALLLVAAVSIHGQNRQAQEQPESLENVNVLAARTSMRLLAGGESSTCFIVSRQTGEVEETILVTAAHAIERCTDPAATLIFRQENERNEMKIPLMDDDGNALWRKHDSLDIAVLPVDLPDSSTVNLLAFENVAGHDQFADETINVGAECMIPCFPVGTESVSPGFPVLRIGTLASYPMTSMDQQTMMIDVTAFGGDSGAPVLVESDSGELLLAGMVFAKQQQTDRTITPYEETVRHTPMGISLAVKSGFIRELIGQLD